jgi:hypothetical protein
MVDWSLALRYMRIEFGGAKLANGGGNLNSLLIAGAGNGYWKCNG